MNARKASHSSEANINDFSNLDADLKGLINSEDFLGQRFCISVALFDYVLSQAASEL